MHLAPLIVPIAAGLIFVATIRALLSGRRAPPRGRRSHGDTSASLIAATDADALSATHARDSAVAPHVPLLDPTHHGPHDPTHHGPHAHGDVGAGHAHGDIGSSGHSDFGGGFGGDFGGGHHH